MIRRVVVTGGSGRVGRAVVNRLKASFEVVVADLVPGDPECENLRLDVMDLDAVRAALRGADAVVHLAAIDFDWKAAPERYIDVNTRGSWHVLQSARELGVRKAVLCSSISACGLSEMRADWRPRFLPVDEMHENRPVQAYSVSKLVVEEMGRAFANGGGIDVICLRPVAVVLPETLGDYLDFVDAPDRRWLFYYVTGEDVAAGFEAALHVEGIRFDTFFLAADDTSRPEPTLEWYARLLGEPPPVVNPRRYALHPRASIFSNARARDRLGWAPTSDFVALRRQAGR